MTSPLVTGVSRATYRAVTSVAEGETIVKNAIVGKIAIRVCLTSARVPSKLNVSLCKGTGAANLDGSFLVSLHSK